MRELANPAPLRPAAQPAVTEDSRNLRRDIWLICTPRWRLSGRRPFRPRFLKAPKPRLNPVEKRTESGVATSAQFVQVNLWIPYLGGLHQFIPGDFASVVAAERAIMHERADSAPLAA